MARSYELTDQEWKQIRAAVAVLIIKEGSFHTKHRIGEQTVDNFNFLFTIDFRPMIIAPFDFFNEALV